MRARPFGHQKPLASEWGVRGFPAVVTPTGKAFLGKVLVDFPTVTKNFELEAKPRAGQQHQTGVSFAVLRQSGIGP